jgi:hypothetical protein
MSCAFTSVNYQALVDPLGAVLTTPSGLRAQASSVKPPQ